MAKKKSFFKTYGFIVFMLAGIVGGCIVGALNPVVKDASGEIIDKGATVLEPIGTVFINLMFCVVVPMVFCSIASAIANMSSAKRAGKVMGLTVGTLRHRCNCGRYHVRHRTSVPRCHRRLYHSRG